jgi:hypothetical protein
MIQALTLAAEHSEGSKFIVGAVFCAVVLAGLVYFGLRK